VLEIAFGQRTLKVEVTEINETANKANAPAMYKELA
jgi:ribosomal 50S subunit-recycling heat shock protein